MPPSRQLAQAIGVNRSTVCRAYAELWAQGCLESRPGSYSTVRRRTRLVPSPRRPKPTLIDWDKASSPGARRVWEQPPSVGREGRRSRKTLDFASLTADPSLCPVDDLRRALRRVLLEQGRELLGYGDPAGYMPLRETIARRMRIHGVRVTADEILITQGAQQALDLVLRMLARPGASMALEAPTYGLILPLQRFYGLRPVEIPVTADGMDLDCLELALARTRPCVLYTMPSFHNPTGVTMSQKHRERLLALCERFRVPILEDGFEEDMKFFGRAIRPIKAMDAHGIVIYVGTLSKVVFPGLRIGWIAAEGPCARRLGALMRVSTLSGNVLAQAAVERFCSEGRYDVYVRHLHATFRKRMTALLRGLDSHIPSGSMQWTRPAGGSTLWARVVGVLGTEEHKLIDCASREGVALTVGSGFFATPSRELHFRLSIARVQTHQIDEGCRRLARAILPLRSAKGRRSGT